MTGHTIYEVGSSEDIIPPRVLWDMHGKHESPALTNDDFFFSILHFVVEYQHKSFDVEFHFLTNNHQEWN